MEENRAQFSANREQFIVPISDQRPQIRGRGIVKWTPAEVVLTSNDSSNAGKSES